MLLSPDYWFSDACKSYWFGYWTGMVMGVVGVLIGWFMGH